MQNRSQRVNHVAISGRSNAGRMNRKVCVVCLRESKETSVARLGRWKEGESQNLRLRGAWRPLQVMKRILDFILTEKGSHWIPSDFKRRAILLPVFRTDCWKGVGRNTQTSQEAIAISQERVMVGWSRAAAVEVMR